MDNITNKFNTSTGSRFRNNILASDYLEISLLCIVVIAGVPLNIASLVKTCKSRKRMPKNVIQQHELHYSYFLLMKLNMSIANLLMLVGYCVPFIIWMITFRWLAGDFLCKLYKFISFFAFHASSHMMEVMALERVLAIFSPITSFKIWCVPMGSLQHRLLILGWVGAALLSMPAWFIYATYEVGPDFTQCLTVWNGQRLQAARSTKSSNDSEAISQTDFTSQEIAVTAAHLVTNFWLPMLVISGAYVSLYIRAKNIQKNSQTRRAVSDERASFALLRQTTCTTAMLSDTFSEQTPCLSDAATSRHQLLSGGNVRRSGSSRLFSATLLVVVVFIFCWFPYFCAASSMFHIKLPWQFGRIAKVLVISDSAFNIFLYRIPDLKQSDRKVLLSAASSSAMSVKGKHRAMSLAGGENMGGQYAHRCFSTAAFITMESETTLL